MRKLILSLGVAASTLTLFAVPTIASADSYYRHHHRHYYSSSYAERHRQSCESARRRRANTGTVIGGLGGALAGNALSHGGGKLGGTLIGGGVGAVVGHSVADRRKGDC